MTAVSKAKECYHCSLLDNYISKLPSDAIDADEFLCTLFLDLLIENGSYSNM